MITTNQPQKTDSKIDYNLWNWIVQKVRKHENTNYDPTKFIVKEESNGRFISIRAFNSPTSYIEDFGIKSLSGNKIGIYGGDITIGTTVKIAPDTTLTITTPTAYAGWQYTYGSSDFAIVNFGSTFTTDDAYIRKPLYTLVQDICGTAISVKRIKQPSEVFPANFSI